MNAESGDSWVLGDDEEGPPDITLMGGPWCSAGLGDLGFECTLPPNHTGRHLAGDGVWIVAAWPGTERPESTP